MAKSYSTCIDNGIKFVAHSQDSWRNTQNSSISVLGIDGNMFYGILEEIIELSSLSNFSVVLFKCKWLMLTLTKKKL